MKNLSEYINEAISDKNMHLDSITPDIDGTENQYDYVDLGLPSGTMWATCNVGTDKQEDEGLLFQFGRIDGYKYGDTNTKFRTKDQNLEDTGSKYIPLTTSGKVYRKNKILYLDDDAAHINMGGKWRMPTKNEIQDLLDNTRHEVANVNGVKGMLFTSNINEHKLFIPFMQGPWIFGNWENDDKYTYAALLSSQVHRRNLNYAYSLDCDHHGDGFLCEYHPRAFAFTIRGVFKK